MLLQNKTMLISGVLGDIALNSLRTLKDNGAYIIGFDKLEPQSDEQLADIDEFYKGDVFDDTFLTFLKENCASRVDILYNNIGEGSSNSFTNCSDQEFMSVFEVNCLSAIRLTRIFVPSMISKKAGSIINFSSILSQNPVPTLTPYATAKSALVGFTKSLAIELAPQNIRVNALLLGYSDTKNNEDYFSSENGINFINRFIPTKKLVDKTKVGHLLAYLGSDASESMTGATLKIDRGHSIW